MSCQFTRRIPELRRNITLLYRRHTIDADIVAGTSWYPNARHIVMEWATHYGYHDVTVACVIAALSPQCSWERNLIIADDILAGRTPSLGALRKNVAKAQAIRLKPAPNLLHYFPHGPKVFSFACNLAGDDSFVTVDTHMMQAALADVQANYQLPWTPYSIFAQCYQDVAIAQGIAPATFQAILWHTWKRLHPAARKRIDRQQWHVVGELED